LLRVAVNAEQLLYRSPGGIGRYTAQLLTVLPATCTDVEPIPFTARHPAGEIDRVLTENGVAPQVRARAVRLGLPRPLLYESWVRFGLPHLTIEGVDLVHAPSVAVPPRDGGPLVVTVHDAAPVLFPESFPRRGLHFHLNGLAAAARRADVVITGSNAAAEEISAHSAIPPDRVRVVYYGVAPARVEAPSVEAVLGARGLAGRRYVLWVGSLEPRKGVGTLLAAMASLRRRGLLGEVLTVLAGFEGWRQEGLLDSGDRAALGESLVTAGRVSEEELWCLYAGATLFAFPSRHEGFGLPVVEAMTQGTAVVASDIPALREIVAGAGVLVTPDQPEQWAAAIEGLLGDDAARSRLGAAGRERSEVFAASRMATATRAVYQEVAS
jgi:glycosyltransferase involved in cell wall biosynthesis